MTLGRVVRGIAGFFYVEPFEDFDQLVECSARGRLKLNADALLVGDKVEFELENGKGVITKVLPRENLLKRPYIANVSLIVLVFAHENPDPNDLLIAKFLLLAESSGIPYLMVFNKTDLVSKSKANFIIEKYRNNGYEVLNTSVRTHLGKRTLQKHLAGKIAVFSGPSGVGKSALLNMVAPGLELRTGEVSRKIGRGKHTTREVQLMKFGQQGYIADTPGFTQISLEFIEPQELANYFPEFLPYRGDCKFASCCHDAEPNCGVKQAVAEGKIANERYQNYLSFLAETREFYKNRYR